MHLRYEFERSENIFIFLITEVYFFCTVSGYKCFKLLFVMKYLYKHVIQCDNGVKGFPKSYSLQRIISGRVVIFSGMT